ncbi:MAG: MaoC/PaaZ C-terminal domain-containing protein [Dehalococcoidia bacterium]|nr:MaoC/PaaZ C-terminal domain-containing protein [Dehalococcoidia bacterium]
MSKKLYFEDVEVGTQIPTLVKHPTTRQLVKWAGASGDWYEIHYDKDVALKNNLPGVIVHGWVAFAGHGQVLGDWIGVDGDILKIGCSYRGMLLPGHDVSYKGKVTKKYQEGGKNLVDCEISCEDDKGTVANVATATVALPSKS